MKVIDNTFEISDTVYLKTDPNQYPRIIYGIIVYNTSILYRLAMGPSVSDHYDFEMSADVNEELKEG